MSIEITVALLEQVEKLPSELRKEFLIPILPAIFDQDEFDHYSDWVNEDKYPTFTMLALGDLNHGDFFYEILKEYNKGD